ncbi:MAG: DUF2975 domain-containing protein [Chloroflexi bacterium]|nr:DUF2975 domain-containing protein [Chloroflexota bacterium]
MKIRVQTIIVELGVLFAILLTLAFGAYLVPMSHDVAAVNPTITYMRVPVLLMAWAVLACALAALLMAFLLLERIRKSRIFEQKSVSLLKGIGICALAAILPMVILIIYTEAHVAGSITNLWVMLGIFAMIIAAIFIFLVAALFQRAVDYKEEVDLTV